MSFLDGKKTYIGIIVAVAPTVASLFGYLVSPEAILELGSLLNKLAHNAEGMLLAGGALFAWYGRAVTKG